MGIGATGLLFSTTRYGSTEVFNANYFGSPDRSEITAPASHKSPTSQAAAASLSRAKIGAQAARIMAVCEQAARPLSREQIIERYEGSFCQRLKEAAACGRINALVKAGRLCEAGTTTGSSGRQVTAYKVVAAEK